MSGRITSRKLDGGAVVRLSGEIDLQNSPDLRRELLDRVADGDPVVVDLAQVSYIDSSGIACLVEAYQMARRHGLRFALAAVSPAALRVLRLARLDEVFIIRDQVADALKGE
ncbi:MAG: STAS domain-containing protein [Telmatospirillum sp.]|nr:STAS domain-containing protein [Telmatospirillum sp.]